VKYKEIKAISFDADGTLLGTFTEGPRGFENFFLKAAKSHGHEITLEVLDPILRKLKEDVAHRRKEGWKPHASAKNSRLHWLWFYEMVFAALHIPHPKEKALELIGRFERGEFTSLYSDALPILSSFATKNLPMMLVSNYGPLLETFLTKFEISKFFKAILISGVVGIEKPDPELYRKGAVELGLSPFQILHIGNDLEEDYYAAKRAGFEAILLDRDELYQTQDIPKIRTLLELENLL